MVSRVSSLGCSSEVSRPSFSRTSATSAVDVLPGLGAGGEGGDAAAGVVLGEDPADDGPAAVPDAGEDDLRDVPVAVSRRGWCSSGVPRGGVGFVVGVLVRDDDVVCALADVRVEPGDEADGDGGADELGDDETGHGAGGDAGEGVGEDPADGDGGVRERGASR